MTYLVTDDAGENGVIVDPSVSCATVRARCGGLPKISAILLTHGHFDHILTLDEWREATGSPVCIASADACMLSDPRLSCFAQFLGSDKTFAQPERLLRDGDRIPVGGECLRVMLTPGHTAGSAVFVGDGFLLTGDTIFAGGGYGRTDLPSGSECDLRASIRDIFALGMHYRIYPGHGGDSVLEDEKYYHYL